MKGTFRPRVKTRFAQILCGVALCQLLGGHWAILQTAAWVGMAFEYCAHDGVQAGLTETFDGTHPCDLCKSIAKNRTAEKNHSTLIELGKINPILQAGAPTLAPPSNFWYRQLIEAHARGVVRSPLVPPPRALLG
jgi:hypothetical protein